ncbi:MAG: zinc ABC transporter substrate-binding protein [Pseudomonadota bacterium]
MRINRRTMMASILAAAAMPGFRPAFASDLPDVVVTTGMIADAVRQVGKDVVSVTALMGPGIDPHAYRQTRTDIVALTRADAVLWHGLFLEAQMEQFLLDLAARRPVTAVAEKLPKDLLISDAEYDGRFDPHVWMDPALWDLVVAEVAGALTALRPDLSDTIDTNSAAHRAEIARLDAYSAEVLTSVPAERRVLVTAHDAFGYFGAAYGFEVLGIQGISTASEAGLARISELVDMLVQRRIGAVFVESSVSDRNVRALVEGAAAQGHQVAIGGSLFSDAMGPAGTYEGTYLGMIDHNVTTIASALGGHVPERGMDGRLSAGL